MLNETNSTSGFLNEFEEEGIQNQIITEVDTNGGIETISTPPVFEEEAEEEVQTEESTKEVENKEEEVITEDKEVESLEDDEESVSYSYKTFLSHLSDEGLVSFEDSDDLEDTPELIYHTVKKTVEDGINSYKESIPEKGKQLLEYLEKGGDINKFIETLQRPLDLDSLDLSSEVDQEKVMREYLKTQEYTNEEIDETISDYKDGLLLDKQAKVAAKKLEKAFEKRNENLIKAQEEQAQIAAQEYSRQLESISNTIESSTTLAGLEITKAEKDAFRKYLLLKDKEGFTSYEREISEDPVKTQLELAYLKFKKYDFSKAKKQGETSATKKLNSMFKQTDKKIAGKSSQEVQDEGNGLSAFDIFRAKNKG